MGSAKNMSKYTPSKLGKYIKKIRTKKGLTQKGLVALSNSKTKRNISLSFESSIEDGYRQKISDTTILDTFSKLLDIPSKKLYQLDGFNVDNIYQRIGLNFKKTFDRHHITISHLKRLHIAPNLIPYWCKGTYHPTVFEELAVAKKLHLNLKLLDPYRQKNIKEHLHRANEPIKKLRLEHGYSINQVAKKTDISEVTLFNAERRGYTSLKNLFILSKFYGVAINSLTTIHYSLYNVYSSSKHIGTRLMIIRDLKQITLNDLNKNYHYKINIKRICNLENNKIQPNVNDIGILSIIYKLSFKALLTLSNLRINKCRQTNSGAILKEIRLHKHLYLRDISKKLHGYIRVTGLSRWEHSHHLRNINVLPYLANIYNLRCSELLRQLGITIKPYKDKMNSKNRNLLSRNII